KAELLKELSDFISTNFVIVDL
ncbi:MAG: hypothetical protein RL769_532, partial [Pseudomonadota bacterium]